MRQFVIDRRDQRDLAIIMADALDPRPRRRARLPPVGADQQPRAKLTPIRQRDTDARALGLLLWAEMPDRCVTRSCIAASRARYRKRSSSI